ncbi:DUF3817 domain-containing protein [Naumannella huperziae]
MTPRSLFRTVAIAEAITWTLLIIGLVLRGLGVTDLGVRIGGGVHGFAFLCYVCSTVFVGLNQRWRAGTLALGIGAAFVPWLTIPFERWLERRDDLAGGWRTGGDAGRFRTWVIGHPVPALLITLIGVAAVFGFLLWLGPPSGWSTRFG